MKIKIVRVVIGLESWENVCQSQDEYVTSVLRRCAEWSPRGDNYWSEPLTSFSKAYSEIMHALSDRAIKHEILDITDDYFFYATLAPEDYDYDGFGTMNLFTGPTIPAGSKSERFVAIPKKRIEYQLGRYHSGMYGARKVA